MQSDAPPQVNEYTPDDLDAASDKSSPLVLHHLPISGNQWQSDALRCTQMRSEALTSFGLDLSGVRPSCRMRGGSMPSTFAPDDGGTQMG